MPTKPRPAAPGGTKRVHFVTSKFTICWPAVSQGRGRLNRRRHVGSSAVVSNDSGAINRRSEKLGDKNETRVF